jgi:iron-sulfur cluster repair protein YtfE (RIC family)
MVAIRERASGALRAEHVVLRREAAHLARLASELSDWSVPDTPDQLQQIRGFLNGRLLPHAQAEEAVMYPMMDKVMGAEQFTITMVADHEAIHRRIDALTTLITTVGQGPPTPAQAEALREHLYALWAIVDLHLDKEESILFDLLDARLTPADARTLTERTQAFHKGDGQADDKPVS